MPPRVNIIVVFVGIIIIIVIFANFVQTPEWIEGDCCHKCGSPFFWNFRKMWDEKTIGNRQVGLTLTASVVQKTFVLKSMNVTF